MAARSAAESGEGWRGQVEFAPGPDPFAYRPGEILVVGEAAADAGQRLFHAELTSDPEPIFSHRDFAPEQSHYRLKGDVSAVEAVDQLREQGHRAQPNHVFFAHSCCCGPHPSTVWGATSMCGSPVYASPVYASPVYASPVYASPVYASPVYASPVYASPVYASPVYASAGQATGRRRSSAVACAPPTWVVETAADPLGVSIAVLDTGLAADGFRPTALDSFTGSAQGQLEVPDDDADTWLDPAAGHGTFIAGLIAQALPGCGVKTGRVLSGFGDGDEVAIARKIVEMAPAANVLNLSFGGYSRHSVDVLATAVRFAQQQGCVVVASAGNDATCRPTYPAALKDVVSVGALGPLGPAPFSNYGAWVRACAPGVDVVSRFFENFDGYSPPGPGGEDPDRLEGWARWSGTSFAAPLVAAAIARDLVLHGGTGPEAVARVVDAPSLFRIPNLGTVVNLV